MRPALTLPSLAACLFLALVALLPSEPWASSRPSGYAFEVSAESDQSGLVQLYYDVGRGLNEPDSAIVPILAGKPALLRLELPSGRYRALRFDPLDRSARMTFSGARVADAAGRTVVAFAPSQFKAGNQIRSLVADAGRFTMETEPRATDPQLMIRLEDEIRIPAPSVFARYLCIFGLLLGGVFGVGWARRAPGLRFDDRVRALWDWAGRSPARALALAAVAGTVVANYPVILLGKSFVSPSQNVALLYGQSPWLPGFQGSEEGDPNGADVGAVMWHHVPLSMVERRAVASDGELPLWNRYDSAGLPLLGQGQSCFGDPLHLIPLCLNGSAWSWDLKYLVAKALFSLGVGLCAWRAFRNLPVSLLHALSVSFIGFYVYRIDHPAIFSLCYSPWILFCWLGCSQSRSAREASGWLVGLMGASWMVMNSGTVKEAYILLLSTNFAGFCVTLFCARPCREKVRLLGGAVAAGLLFAMISCPVWLIFVRALKVAYTSYNAPLAFQLEPGLLIGLFDEAFYRPFQLNGYVVNPSANLFVLLGVLFSLVRWRALLANRVAAALALCTIPLLALVYGIVPPGLIARVPFLGNILHIDNTFSCALITILCVLSAFGWTQAWEQLGTPEGRTEGRLVLTLLALIFAAYFGTVQTVLRSIHFATTWGKLVHLDPFLWGYAASLMVGAMALVGAIASARRKGSVSVPLFLFAALGFGVFHWREALQVGPGFTRYVVRPTKRMDFLADSTAVNAIRGLMDTPSRVVGFHNDLFPGWSGVYRLEGISGPDALMNPLYRAFMDAAGVNRIWDWRYIIEPGEVAPLKPVLDALGVRFYVGYHLGEVRPGRELVARHSSDMDVFESPSAWPRAYFTDSVAAYTDLPQYISWIKAGDGRPFAAIEGSDWNRITPVPVVSGNLATRRVVPAAAYRLTTNTTSFSVDAPGPGFIVLTEAFEPGNFRATLNGKAVPVIRVNHAFKGVYVDAPGSYAVTFSYWPRGLTAALAVAAAGLGLLLLSLVLALRRPVEGPKPLAA